MKRIADLPGLVRELERAEGKLANVDELTRQRDELLIALQDLIGKLRALDGEGALCAVEIEAARAVIADIAKQCRESPNLADSKEPR
jgi:hypothetical protein